MTHTTASSAPATGQRTSGAWTAKERSLFVASLCAHLPLVALHLRVLWRRPHYQFFPVLLVAVGVLLWHRWPVAEEVGQAAPRSANRLSLLGLVLLVAAVASFSPWLGFVAAILTLAGTLAHLAGRAFWTHLCPAWILLWLLVPPPFGLDLRLIEWLQALTSRAASAALDQFGVLHVLAGNVIQLPGRQLFVEEACSGIQSLFALMSSVALFAVWARRHAVVSLLLVGSAVFWAGLFNVVRVVAVALALAWWGNDLSSGWPHELLGVAVFVMALAMILSTDRLLWLLSTVYRSVSLRILDWWTGRRRHRRSGGHKQRIGDGNHTAASAPEREEDTHRRGQAVSGFWRSQIVIGAFACLAVLQILILVVPQDSTVRLSEATASLGQSVLPSEHNGWKLVEYAAEERELRSEFGQHSRAWHYSSPSYHAVMSFDFPFEGWHEVTRCYRSQGWNVLSRVVNGDQTETPSGAQPHVVVELSKPTGEHGYLLFTVFDETGRPVRPPVSAISIWSKLYFKILQSPTFRLFRSSDLGDADAVTYQVQAFISTDFRLSSAQHDEIRSQFLYFTTVFRDRWDDKREDVP